MLRATPPAGLAGASAVGRAASNSVSTLTPAKRVSNFDHVVTQWMSPRYSERGSRCASSQLHVVGSSTRPSTVMLQVSGAIRGAVSEPLSWTWDEFLALPSETPIVDIHCVTKWSKLDTTWKGVALDTLFDFVATEAEYVTAWSDGGYTTNVPLADLLDGKAWIAYGFGGEPLEPEHGGPARLLVPHLYFWKSAKWVRGLSLTLEDEPGFWEVNGYHDYGDPWREQRYQGD